MGFNLNSCDLLEYVLTFDGPCGGASKNVRTKGTLEEFLEKFTKNLGSQHPVGKINAPRRIERCVVYLCLDSARDSVGD